MHDHHHCLGPVVSKVPKSQRGAINLCVWVEVNILHVLRIRSLVEHHLSSLGESQSLAEATMEHHMLSVLSGLI